MLLMRLHIYLASKAKVNIILCTKGFVNNPQMPFFSDYISSRLPSCINYILSGPGFAEDIISGSNVLLSLASKDISLCSDIKNLFLNSNISLIASEDINGIQIFAVLKNILALCIGYMEGKKKSPSEIIKHMLEFLYDSKDLLSFFGSDFHILSQPACLGDIILTCFYDKSRNKSFGKKLALGKINKNVMETIEGARNIMLLMQILCYNGIAFNKFKNLAHDIIEKLENAKDR
jgi:glycerol-3-phosphate dehydrogenase (NAD(P)+)